MENSLKQFPGSPHLLRVRAMIYLKADQTDLAYVALQELPTDDPALKQALRRRDPEIRAAAAKLIAERSLPIATLELMRGLDDSVPAVRRHCARALGNRRAREALKPLFRLLQDSDWFVRAEACAALGEINDPRAAGWLIQLLNDGDGFVRHTAASALRRVACEVNRNVLVDAFRRADQPAQFSIAVALAKLGDPLAIVPLTDAASSTNNEVRRRAAASLGDFAAAGDVAVVASVTNALARLLADADESVRDYARLSLDKFESGRTAIP